MSSEKIGPFIRHYKQCLYNFVSNESSATIDSYLVETFSMYACKILPVIINISVTRKYLRFRSRFLISDITEELFNKCW